MAHVVVWTAGLHISQNAEREVTKVTGFEGSIKKLWGQLGPRVGKEEDEETSGDILGFVD